MTQSKHTKRALLSSVLAMLVCVAMLIGSTFAWFTDSVTSGKNKIVAGNLDVELEYKDGSEWRPVGADTNLFKPTEGENATLWEPGHTEYVQLRIRNAGTLALTYSFTVNVYGDENGGPENTYINVNDESFKLSDYLVFSKTDYVETVSDRESLWRTGDAEEAAMGNMTDLAATGVLLPDEGSNTEAFTLAVYMPTWVGNKANYKTDTEVPTIYLGLTLNATQTPHEEDSFGSDYDQNAAADGFLKTYEKAEATVSEVFNNVTDKLPDAGNDPNYYTWEQLQGQVEGLASYYVPYSTYSGTAPTTLTVGGVTYSAADTTRVSVGGNNFIEDEVFYCEDGVIYLAAPVATLELADDASTSPSVTDVKMENENGGTVEKNEDGTYTVTLKNGTTRLDIYVGAEEDDKVLTKKVYTYCVNGEVKAPVVSYGTTAVETVDGNPVGIYPLWYTSDRAALKQFSGTTLEYTIYIEDKGIVELQFIIEVAD